jgi:hypothetical protein
MIFLAKRIGVFLGNVKRAIDVAMIDTIIGAALLVYSWDNTVLSEGLQYYETAQHLYEEQIKEKGQQVAARRVFENKLEDVNIIYMEHIKFCRLIYWDNEKKLAELTLNVQRKQTITGWLTQAKTFYSNALKDDELITKLGRYGITREKMVEGQDKILEVEQAKEQHDIETGEAQDATRLRDEAIAILYRWVIEFLTVCRAALKDRPEQLEKMGIKHYSPGYKRKSKEKEEPETILENDIEEIEGNLEKQFQQPELS